MQTFHNAHVLTHYGSPLAHLICRLYRCLCLCCVLLNGLGSLALAAEAPTPLVVTSLADPGTGGCDSTECTLREAIAAAQPEETITFAPTLFATGPGKITLTSGPLLLDKALTIQGPGQHRLRIDGNRVSRVVTITESGVITLTGLTIQRGRCQGCDGGGFIMPAR